MLFPPNILDCRGFPPTAGLTYSCWFQINRFSSACDSHPIRFLSVVRHMSRSEQQFICLSISLSASDGCLVISTEEEALTYLGKLLLDWLEHFSKNSAYCLFKS